MLSWARDEPYYGVNFVNFVGSEDIFMKPMSVGPMVLLLILVLFLIFWLSGGLAH